YERDGYRCMAPGCTARCCNDDHHVHYRSRGGKDGFENELCLCRFHHQQGEHGRYARVRGRAPLDLVFRLGTPETGEWYKNERRLGRRAAWDGGGTLQIGERYCEIGMGSVLRRACVKALRCSIGAGTLGRRELLIAVLRNL